MVARLRVGVRIGIRVRRRGAVRDRIGCRTGRAFVVFGVVIVGRLHRDFRAFLRGGQGEGAVGRAANRLAVGKPLVFDAARRYAVVVCYGRFQFAAHFGVASNDDFAFVVGCWWRGNGVVRCGSAGVGAGAGAVAVMCAHDAAVFDGIRVEGDFAGSRVDMDVIRPGAFRHPFAAGVLVGGQGLVFTRFVGVFDFERGRLVVRGDDDAALVRVISGYGWGIQARRGHARIVIRGDAGIGAGGGAVAVVGADGAAVLDVIRGEGDFACGFVKGDGCRPVALFCPFAACIFAGGQGVFFACFVGVFDFECGRLVVRGDDDAAFVRAVFGNFRRGDGLWLRIG